MGGLGVEWSHDVAAAPDDTVTVVSFNVIGVRGESLEQIGFVHLDRDGHEVASQFEDEEGATLHFGPSRSFAIAPSGDMVVSASGRIVIVTGADACTAAVAELDSDGTPRWRRSLPVNGCGGRDLVVHGVAVTPTNRVVVGGALSSDVDLGSGTLHALATDAFVVDLQP